jgi:hypothetical protein
VPCEERFVGAEEKIGGDKGEEPEGEEGVGGRGEQEAIDVLSQIDEEREEGASMADEVEKQELRGI